MWAMTKPNSARPVIAITYLAPSDERTGLNNTFISGPSHNKGRPPALHHYLIGEKGSARRWRLPPTCRFFARLLLDSPRAIVDNKRSNLDPLAPPDRTGRTDRPLSRCRKACNNGSRAGQPRAWKSRPISGVRRHCLPGPGGGAGLPARRRAKEGRPDRGAARREAIF